MNGIREENTLFTNIITELKKCATVQDCESSDIEDYKYVVFLDDAINIVKRASYRILLVEDGSIDVDELKQFIDEHDLPIKVVIYRAGANPPRFLYDSKM